MLIDVWGRVRDYVTAALLVAAVVSTVGWRITSADLNAEKAGRKGDADRYAAAQKDYENKALIAKAQKEKEDADKAAKADASYSALLDKYNASLLRYQAAQRTISHADLPGAAETPKSDDGPSGSSIISIPLRDAQICAINTARLQALKKWADDR